MRAKIERRRAQMRWTSQKRQNGRGRDLWKFDGGFGRIEIFGGFQFRIFVLHNSKIVNHPMFVQNVQNPGRLRRMIFPKRLKQGKGGFQVNQVGSDRSVANRGVIQTGNSHFDRKT